MNVLFVSSGNSNSGINPIIQNQADSLKEIDVNIGHFTISGKGFRSYLNSVFLLRRFLKQNKYDLIHAHYSFSGIVASLAFRKTPVIVSLMGSDIYQSKTGLLLVRIFTLFFWKQCIVKTQEMKNKVNLKRIEVIPNGVDLNKYKPQNKEKAIETIHWDNKKTHILFAANPDRFEKNVSLAKSAIEVLNEKQNIQLQYLKNIAQNDVPLFINASDIVILCSLWEGSPNVIKEAMACNRTIVTTKVGDVEWLMDSVEGCYIADTETIDYSEKLNRALIFAKEKRITNGRDRILNLGLDSESIAKRILIIYKNTLKG